LIPRDNSYPQALWVHQFSVFFHHHSVNPQIMYTTNFLYCCNICLPLDVCNLQDFCVIKIPGTPSKVCTQGVCCVCYLIPEFNLTTVHSHYIECHRLLLSADSPYLSDCLYSSRSSYPTTSLHLIRKCIPPGGMFSGLLCILPHLWIRSYHLLASIHNQHFTIFNQMLPCYQS
jgi:hypothetical protein